MTMDWLGASVFAPRPDTAIEFQIAAEAGSHRGYFRGSMFFIDGDASGYPRRMVRRWRYADEASVRSDDTLAAAND
jgi:hypothetical protein